MPGVTLFFFQQFQFEIKEEGRCFVLHLFLSKNLHSIFCFLKDSVHVFWTMDNYYLLMALFSLWNFLFCGCCNSKVLCTLCKSMMVYHTFFTELFFTDVLSRDGMGQISRDPRIYETP